MEGFDCGGDGWQHDTVRMARPWNLMLRRTMPPPLMLRAIKCHDDDKAAELVATEGDATVFEAKDNVTRMTSKRPLANTRLSCSLEAEIRMICMLV